MKTILTGELTKEQIAENEAESLDWQLVQDLLNDCYEYYIDVDTKPDLKKFCELLCNIANDFRGDVLQDGIPVRACDRMIGELVRKAVAHDRVEERKGKSPVNFNTVFETLIKRLVDRAYSDGHKKKPINDTELMDAFSLVADLLYKRGITYKGDKYTSAAIRKLYYK